MAKKTKYYYDYTLLVLIIWLTMFGLIMIYSASSYTAQLQNKIPEYYMWRQAGIALGGFVIMIVVSRIPYTVFARFALLAYITAVILMVVVDVAGIKKNGKRRWLGVGGLQFQPTEFAKIALILALAVVLTKVASKNSEKGLFFWVWGLTVPLALLIGKNNLSSGLIVMGIAFVMWLVVSRKKLFFALITGGALAFLIAIPRWMKYIEKLPFIQSYQLERIQVWLDPAKHSLNGGFQVLQGLYAIGSGGIMGKGLGDSIQKLGFVPEAQNDMIFAIICEELGLFGAIEVVLLFLIMLFRFLVIATNAPDLFGALVVIGVMAQIAIQVILNIAVVTNTIPNTGITLPFISYGGTSVLFLMIEMGMVLSVSNSIKVEQNQ